MPPSSAVNVFRYSALGFGVFYGFMHRRTLQKEHDVAKACHEELKREELLAKAKEAWKQKQTKAKGDDLVTDPDDPRFDLEKLLAKLEHES
ncbi:ATP synthase E chain-domain-containing protein [Vararia minispora EC-137]|uniref:ATP synthase E chain-domain-containing protein n=1 Tax=Vararia minispora EC-137 TaxID=1314806 RepID=A0ACB8QUA0_9AGAM|nr:ATP synthase E chain-domain-containing protein [Vararia minispora EC-137]